MKSTPVDIQTVTPAPSLLKNKTVVCEQCQVKWCFSVFHCTKQLIGNCYRIVVLQSLLCLVANAVCILCI